MPSAESFGVFGDDDVRIENSTGFESGTSYRYSRVFIIPNLFEENPISRSDDDSRANSAGTVDLADIVIDLAIIIITHKSRRSQWYVDSVTC
jgi:hypothetical protein